MQPLWGKPIERAIDGTGLGEQQSALPEIIERKRRQRHAEPGDTDRQRPEMAHVGIERLAAGHRQESATYYDKRQGTSMPQVGDGRQRTQGSEDGRGPGNSHYAKC